MMRLRRSSVMAAKAEFGAGVGLKTEVWETETSDSESSSKYVCYLQASQ